MSRQSSVRNPKPGSVLDGTRDWEHSVRQSVVPFADVEVDVSAAATAVVQHRLGRRYAWAQIRGQETSSGTARVFAAGTPAATDAAGYDASKEVYLFSDAGGTWTGTILLRVYAS